MVQVLQFYLKNSLRNFNYVLYSDSTKEAIFVDPADLDLTLPKIKSMGLIPKYLLNTHFHPDHIKDNERFLQLSDVTRLKLSHAEQFEFTPGEVVEAVHTPGHVSDHVCFYIKNKKKMTGVVTGDTVFNAGVGNCKNGGNPDELYESIRDFFIPLENDVAIYPSHDYFLNNLNFAATIEPENEIIREFIGRREKMDLDEEFIETDIGLEKKINPFFRIFEKFATEEEKRTEFKKLRLMRDKW